METSLLFESFMVFYLLEVLILTAVAVWYYQEDKKPEGKPQAVVSKGPTAAQVMAMYKMAEKVKRDQGA
jgi:hypothetical protein